MKKLFYPKRRLLALATLLTMLLSLCLPMHIFASSNMPNRPFTNWYVHYTGGSTDNFYVERSSEEKLSGDYSMKVVESGATGGNIMIKNPYAEGKIEQATDYVISFALKEVVSGSFTGNQNVGFADGGSDPKALCDINSLNNPEKWSKTELTDGWARYTRTLNSGTNRSTGFLFYFFRGGSADAEQDYTIYIDDVSVRKATDEETVNYIDDGGFENPDEISYGTNEAINDWTVSYTYGGKYLPNEMEAYVTEAEKYSGNASLRVIRKGISSSASAAGLRLTSKSAVTAEKTYNLSFYVKRATPAGLVGTNSSDYNTWITCGAFSDRVRLSNMNIGEPDANGWTAYSYSYTTTGSGNPYITIQGLFDGYIDDIVLTEDGKIENLIANGDFESDSADAYEPKNPLMISGHKDGGVLNTSWRNPTSTALSKVTLTDVTDAANPKILKDDFATTPGKVTEYYTSGLDLDTVYTYKLTFDFSDGEKREIFLAQKPFANTISTVLNPNNVFRNIADSSWKTASDNLDSGGSNPYILPAEFSIDPTGGVDGSPALNIKTNKDASAIRPTNPDTGAEYNWTIGYTRRLDSLTGTYKADTNYRVTFKVRAVSSPANEGSQSAWTRVYLAGNDGYRSLDIGTDWTENSLDLKSGTVIAGRLRMYVAGSDWEDLWLDDIAVYELDAEGNPTGDNLVVNGDFSTYITEGNTVSDISATPTLRGADITYVKGENTRYVRLYEKVSGSFGDTWRLRAVYPSFTDSISLTGLEGREYTYKLQSQSEHGVLEDSAEFTVTPIVPDYETDAEYTLKKDGEVVTELSGAGDYTVSLNVANNKLPDFSPAFIVALYKNDALESYEIEEVSVGINSSHDFSKTVAVPAMAEGASDKYEIRAFLWDGFDTMKPLKQFAQYQ